MTLAYVSPWRDLPPITVQQSSTSAQSQTFCVQTLDKPPEFQLCATASNSIFAPMSLSMLPAFGLTQFAHLKKASIPTPFARLKAFMSRFRGTKFAMTSQSSSLSPKTSAVCLLFRGVQSLMERLHTHISVRPTPIIRAQSTIRSARKTILITSCGL